MRINELLVENQQIDEISLAGLGKGIGKAANIAGKAVGGAVGGTVAAAKQFGSGIKQGYQGSKTAVGGGSTTPGTDSTTTPSEIETGNASDPALLRQQADALNQQADQLEKAAAQPAPTAPTSTASPASTPTAEPAQWPAGLPKFNSVTGQKFASPEEAEKVTNSPEFKQQMADVAAGKDLGSVQATQQQTAPAPTTAPTTPPAGGKMTQAQQDALKAKLQGQRQAGKTTATQTGSGFKDYVDGSQTKLAGADASGAPVFKKLQRESVAFSKFLGVHI
jgi:hypothetical protein